MILAFLVLSLALYPQSTPAEASAIEGTILQIDGRTPLAGARILLRKDQSFEAPAEYGTMSGPEGRFSLTNIAPGRYKLSVTMDGYVRHEYGERRPLRPGAVLDLTTAQALRDLRIVMTPAGTISGRVYQQDGPPMQGVQVQALKPRYVDGQLTFIHWASASTNDLGEYRIYWAPPGRYYLFASVNLQQGLSRADAINEQFQGEQMSFEPTLYPNSPDPLMAVPVHLEPGAELRAVDITLTPHPSIRVSGRVFDGAGEPAANIEVTMQSRRSALPSRRTSAARTDSAGRFELRGLVPGGYTLWALAPNRSAGTGIARAAIQVGDRDILDVQLVMRPTSGISGRMFVDNEQGLPDGRVSISFSAVDGRQTVGSAFAPEGNFELSSLMPDRYRVSVSGLPDSCYVVSIEQAGIDVLHAGLDVGQEANEPLHIFVSSRASRLTGRVLEGERTASAGAQVVLIPARRDRIDLYRTAITDQFGRFEISGIAPGDYKAFAWADLDPGIYFDPSFLSRYEAQGTPLRIDEATTRALELNALPQ